MKDKETDGKLGTKPYKNENAVRWWRYLGKCVCKLGREWHTRVAQFRISPFLEKFHQRKFMEIFVKEQMKADISGIDKRLFEKILLVYDVKKLCKWAEEALYQIEKTNQEEAIKRKSEAGVLGGIFSWGAAKPEKKPTIQETLAQIFELIRKGMDTEAAQVNPKKNYHVLFMGEFRMKKAAIKLYHRSAGVRNETIEAQMDQLVLSCRKRKDGLDVDATIKSVGLLGVNEKDGETIRLISTSGGGEQYLKLSVSLTNQEETKKVKASLVMVLLQPILSLIEIADVLLPAGPDTEAVRVPGPGRGLETNPEDAAVAWQHREGLAHDAQVLAGEILLRHQRFHRLAHNRASAVEEQRPALARLGGPTWRPPCRLP